MPDLDGSQGQVGVLRFGDELERRTHTKRALEALYGATYGLANADKSKDPQKARLAVPQLLLGGQPRGAGSTVYASLCTGGASTISLIERDGSVWSLLVFAVNPQERNLQIVADAEEATLAALKAAAKDENAEFRVLNTVLPTLVFDALHPHDDSDTWLRLKERL